MFENLNRFSPSARRALALAHEQAHALGQETVDPNNLLLALVRNPASPTARVLERLGITPQKLQEEILAGADVGQGAAELHRNSEELPVTPRFKQLLTSALHESLRSGEKTVTTMHILLAIAEDRPSLASRTLAGLGADPQSVREQAAAFEHDADPPARSAAIESPAERPGASITSSAGPPNELPADLDTPPAPITDILAPTRQGSKARPRGRRIRRVARVAQCILLLQLLAFSLLTLKGWGTLPNRDINPPRMERIGAPPGFIDTYASLSHITFPLEYAASREIATAAFAGTPADWGGPEPTPPSLNVFGQSPSTTLHQLAAGSANTIMFIVPSSTLQNGPLYVVIKGDRYRLSLVTDESSLGFAVVTAAVNNHLLSAFASSLLWLTLPVRTSTPVPLMLIQRGPGAQQAYALTHGTLGVTSQTGVIATPLGGVTPGTPVVAITSSRSALAGFLEMAGSGPSSFVSTSVVASVLNAVGPSVSGGN